MEATSASLQPTIASRVTAVPRRSLKVTPETLAFVQAFRHELLKPSAVQGLLSVLSSITGLSFGVRSSIAFNGSRLECGLSRRFLTASD